MKSERSQFLMMATGFQGGLIGLGLLLGWLTGVDVVSQIRPTSEALLTGLVGTIPMLAFFAFSFRFPIGPLKPIKQFLLDELGPSLVECRWYDLVWVSLLAGVSEETIFRGVIQRWFSPAYLLSGIVIGNLAFGLAHAITPTYAVLAGILGIYLGAFHEYVGNRNLVVPIVTHSVYDFVAFVVLKRSYEKSCDQGTETTHAEGLMPDGSRNLKIDVAPDETRK